MSRLEPTAWACINWHNLATKNIQLPGGDVFNVGPMESGKSTWLDAIHLVLSAGQDMDWNSAANPVLSRNQLQEKGRGLRGILYRENDGNPLGNPDEPALSYFLLELGDGTHTITVGVGAYASSYKARAETWWILAPGKGLNQVKCTNEAGQPLGLDDFREANGPIAYRHGKDYRTRLANLIFSGLTGSDDADRHEKASLLMEQWQRFLNSAKSYGKLKGQKDSELIRRALRAPDESALEKARQTVDEITRLQATIQEATRQADQMTDISKAVDRVNTLRRQSLEEDLAEWLIRHRDANDEAVKASAAAEAARMAADALGEQARDLDAQASAAQDTLDTLRKSDEGQRAQRADQLQADLGKASTAMHGAEQRLNARRDAHKAAEADLAKHSMILAEGGRATIARIVTLTERMPGPGRAALGRIEQTVRRHAFEALQASINEAQGTLADLEQQHRDAASRGNDRGKAHKDRADILDEELGRLLARKLPLADEALAEALDGLEAKVIITHQAIEVRKGHDVEASLLEQYLGRGVLAAVIPLDAGDTELVRRRVHARAPHIKVVERSELAPAKLQGVLACLDPTSHPLALQYLAAAYGDVALLEPGDDRDGRGRVVWRDGTVYDGVTWTLEDPKAHGQFLGQAAMQDALARQVQAKRDALATERQAQHALEAEAEMERDQANTLRQLSKELAQAVNPAQLLRHKAEVEKAEGRAVEASRQVEEAHSAHRELEGQCRLLKEQIAEIRRTLDDRSAKKVLDRMQDLKASIASLRAKSGDALVHKGAKQNEMTAALTKQADHTKERDDHEVKLVAARQAYMTFAGVGLAEVTLIEAKYESTKVSTIIGRQKNTGPDLGAAVQNVSTLCLAMGPQRALAYDAERNLVTEAATGESLHNALLLLQRETESKRKDNMRRMQELTRQQIIVPIVEGMKNDLNDLEALRQKMNVLLRKTSINGRHYAIRKTKAEGADKALLALVQNYDRNNPEPVLEAVKDRLHQTRGNIADVFDYRQWYDFRLARVRDDTDEDKEDEDLALVSNHQEKGSGGAQAAPHYVLVYVLMRVFYDTVGSNLQLILLDEAFRGIDTGHQQDLIHIGKELGLTLLTANTDLRGHETRQDTSTTQIFMQDTTTLYSQVKPISQRKP